MFARTVDLERPVEVAHLAGTVTIQFAIRAISKETKDFPAQFAKRLIELQPTRKWLNAVAVTSK